MKNVFYAAALLMMAVLCCSCASTQNITVRADAGGKISVEESLDASFTARLFNPVPGAPLVELKNTKRNFLFFTDYAFSLQPPSLIDRDKSLHVDFPLEFVLSFPGSVQSTNAGKIENGKAVWSMEKGDAPALKLSSRKINVLNIIVFCAFLIFILTKYVQKLFKPKNADKSLKPKT